MTVTDIPDIGRIDLREAVAKNDAACITRIEGLGYQLARQFEKLEEFTAQQLEVGVRREPIFEAHIEAALIAWRLEQAGEAPIGAPIP
jgi:hypothetical protein